uniref:Uncharacterized protein n=1 Tax=Aegilops tauschii TaxID=37682 RepID=M8ATZ4_AEGTA
MAQPSYDLSLWISEDTQQTWGEGWRSPEEATSLQGAPQAGLIYLAMGEVLSDVFNLAVSSRSDIVGVAIWQDAQTRAILSGLLEKSTGNKETLIAGETYDQESPGPTSSSNNQPQSLAQYKQVISFESKHSYANLPVHPYLESSSYDDAEEQTAAIEAKEDLEWGWRLDCEPDAPSTGAVKEKKMVVEAGLRARCPINRGGDFAQVTYQTHLVNLHYLRRRRKNKIDNLIRQ